MADPTKTCPKCDGQFEEGYAPDRAQYEKMGNFPVWVSGQPEKRFLGGLDLAGKTMLNITTFRCLKCGFLESYAR